MPYPNYQACIVDNERPAREMVAALVTELFPGIQLLGQAHGVSSAVELVQKKTPDILFLDVEMDDGTGFDVLTQLTSIPKAVIFVTAFDKYAIEALRASAQDYLLKPINRADFTKAVDKSIRQMENDRVQMAPTPRQTFTGKIALPNLQGFRLIDTDRILRCQADGNYTWVHFDDGEKEMVSRTLGQMESLLSVRHGFLRVHHGHLVNIDHITSYIKGASGGTLIMTDGTEVGVSTRKKPELMQWFSGGG